MTILSLIKLVHLLGLIMGFGGAILADMLVLKGAILNPIDRKTVVAVKSLSHIVFFGLGLLWVSGVILVGIRVSADPNVWLNQKIWAKVIIVCILTVNGIAVHNIALGRLAGRESQKIFSSSRPYEMLGLGFIAAVSSVSWFVPFVLGVATEFNFTVKATVILFVYAVLVLLGWAAFLAVAYLFREREHNPRQVKVRLRPTTTFIAAQPTGRPVHELVAMQFRSELEFLKSKLRHHEERWIEFQSDIQQSVANFDQSLNGMVVAPKASHWKQVQMQSSHIEHRISGADFQPREPLRLRA